LLLPGCKTPTPANSGLQPGKTTQSVSANSFQPGFELLAFIVYSLQPCCKQFSADENNKKPGGKQLVYTESFF